MMMDIISSEPFDVRWSGSCMLIMHDAYDCDCYFTVLSALGSYTRKNFCIASGMLDLLGFEVYMPSSSAFKMMFTTESCSGSMKHAPVLETRKTDIYSTLQQRI